MVRRSTQGDYELCSSMGLWDGTDNTSQDIDIGHVQEAGALIHCSKPTSSLLHALAVITSADVAM